jgi:hypothetical protein
MLCTMLKGPCCYMAAACSAPPAQAPYTLRQAPESHALAVSRVRACLRGSCLRQPSHAGVHSAMPECMDKDTVLPGMQCTWEISGNLNVSVRRQKETWLICLRHAAHNATGRTPASSVGLDGERAASRLADSMSIRAIKIPASAIASSMSCERPPIAHAAACHASLSIQVASNSSCAGASAGPGAASRSSAVHLGGRLKVHRAHPLDC